MEKRDKRGQVTIFIILGIVVVAIAVLVFLFFPKIQSTLGFGEESPSQFLQKCLEDSVSESAERLSLQGGSIEPENYFMYQGERLEYLCYTSNYYLPCVMQRPLLKQHIESEIEDNIREEVSACMIDLKDSFRGKGYNVQGVDEGFNVELLPNVVVASFDSSISLNKGEESINYDSIRVVVDSNIYELVSIANSILNWEATYGDSETTTYMNYYHDLKVEKLKQGEGTTVYILSNRDSGEKFQFASRSVVFPPGYGASEI